MVVEKLDCGDTMPGLMHGPLRDGLSATPKLLVLPTWRIKWMLILPANEKQVP
jgi:hypothetical protein